jgi:PIN domain nuclease of toxin-antitoxin system
MNVLLDTCALLALASGELSDRAAGVLRKAPEAYVSVVSPWEVAIKAAGGKLRLMEPPARWFRGLVARYDLREVPLDADLACAAAALPFHHRDPFDRVIVALAQSHGVTVLTSDEAIQRYPGVTTLW